uniref:Uncharacterized protein n=1 Tax=Astyanax mexicanus TaxID=7994 RepID=A0A3B1JN80_ASTMX
MGQCVTKCKNPTSSLAAKVVKRMLGSHMVKREAEEEAGPALRQSPGSVRRAEPEQEGEGLSSGSDRGDDAYSEMGMEKRFFPWFWRLGSSGCYHCKFTRREFVEGCRHPGDSLQDLSAVPGAAGGVPRRESFKDLVPLTFQFGTGRGRGPALAAALRLRHRAVEAVFHRWTRPPSWSAGSTSCRITRYGVAGISQRTPGTWFLNFTQSIGPDLGNYSEDERGPASSTPFVGVGRRRGGRENERSGLSAFKRLTVAAGFRVAGYYWLL